MPPAVTVLQLDTRFPRIPGDVACADSYRDAVEVLRVPNAHVDQIVSAAPQNINIAPFETALSVATGDIVTTSCGFLSYWQDHLAAQTQRPFVSSALMALDTLSVSYQPGEVLILTFDAQSLGAVHLGQHAAFAAGIVGLPSDLHLRQVIERNLTHLDTARAARELAAFVGAQVRPVHKHILLECTNLPPYRAALRATTDLPITDILTVIEATRPGTVNPQFLEQEPAQ